MRRTSPRPTFVTRAFHLLLALYPAQFRDEYGRELSLVFADRYRAADTSAARARLWAESLWGVLVEAPKEHVRMLRHDLRYALRTLGRARLFAATVIVTLALGIGANTAVFQLIDAIRLRSLPVPDPGRLAEIRIAGGNRGFGLNPGGYGQLTLPIWHELRAHQQAFAGLFSWYTQPIGIGEDHELRRADGLFVSGEFFRVLGIAPWRGRLIEPSDEAPCPAARAVASHGYWLREMGGRDLRADERLRVNGRIVEVVGVTPPQFTGLAVGEDFDLAISYCTPDSVRRDSFHVAVMGRLRPGWRIDRASAHLDALSAGLFEAVAPTGYSSEAIARFKAFRLAAYPASAGVSQLRDEYDRSLWLLLGITALVLLIACANLANLMLARGAGRATEVAVRLALGASRPAIVRQLFAESALLSAMGAVAGLVLAQAITRLLIWGLSSQDGAPAIVLHRDWRLLAFTGLVAAGTCLLCGVAPAARATRVDATAAIRGASRATVGRRRLTMQRALVVTQIAVSLVLLVGALLFVRSFHKLTTLDAGMRQADITVGFFGFHRLELPPARFNDFQRTLVAEVKALPGVIDAATTTTVPLWGNSWTLGVQLDGVEESSKFTWAGPGYFSTMGIPILRGRAFTLQDTVSSARVAIVNETFARTFLGGRDPIGRTLRTVAEPNFPSERYEIVGVIPDTKYSGLRGVTPPMAFAPDSQYPALGPWANLMIRSSLEPSALGSAIAARLAQTHPAVFFEHRGFQARIRDGLVRERLLAMLAGFFGGLAALLAMVGLYGLMAYVVGVRRREIGVRIALGAGRGHVLWLVLRDAGLLLCGGAAAGLLLSLLATRSAGALLFELTPHDPATLAAATAVLAVVAVAASLLPARRAATMDPLIALREE